MSIRISSFLFVIFLAEETFSCKVSQTGDWQGCCTQLGPHRGTPAKCQADANCNVVGGNCAVCEMHYNHDCSTERRCSCFWCCKYPENCPDGCKNCVYDGEGGCNGHQQNKTKPVNALILESSADGGHHARAMSAFEKVDSNSDGMLSLYEAHSYAKAENLNITKEHLGEKFKKMDKNGNGGIEPEEFDRKLKK